MLENLSDNSVPKVVTDPEKYRPNYHFTPHKNWMNDPNGMVYFDGEYHLCFQHDNYDAIFKKMSWGHAVSKDMLHWQELPKVVEPDEELGMCFSGCMVVDKHNTSGLGKDTLIGFYTSELPKQQQSMVYSHDNGRTFTKYKGNPVIRNTEGMSKDFRDPKVMWHEQSKQWVMALAGPERIEFWSSPNLIDWQLESVFGEGHGAHGGEWECPDLRYMAIDGDDSKKVWVLLVSVNPGAPNKGSGTQYFIGDFKKINGKLNFTSSHKTVKWLDWGTDNYAGIAWSNMQDSPMGDQIYSIGWMSNWTYAHATPTSQWRGAMTMIRHLKLTSFDDDVVLTCRPAPFYDSITGKALAKVADIKMNRATKVGKHLASSRIDIELDTEGAEDIGVDLCNKLGQNTRIGYNKRKGVFYIDRRNAGNGDFEEGFACIQSAIAKQEYSKLKMEIYVDKCSVEVFINDAKYAMTGLIFPEEALSIIKPFSDIESKIESLNIRKMHSTLTG